MQYQKPSPRLKIRGVMWHRKYDAEWIACPSREWLDGAGKAQFAIFLEFTDEEVDRRFKAAALSAIRAASRP